jgi:hypothetical protein
MPWVREGYCCRCGECCVGDPWVGNPEERPRKAVVAGYCPLFEWHHGAKEGKGFCAGHIGAVPQGKENKYYMNACRLWPDDPMQIKDKPSCTYTFRWSE